MNATGIRIRPLDGPFGAEVTGVDARADLSAAVRQQLLEAWRKHALLLFREQTLTPEEHLRFVSIFGPIEYDTDNEIARKFVLAGQSPQMLGKGYNFVSNVVESALNPHGPLGYHCDHSMLPNLLLGLSLYAIELPPAGAGGDTLFADMRIAYRSLPEALRAKIQGLTIRHAQIDLKKQVGMPGLTGRPDALSADRALAYTHPDTKEKLLMLSHRHADRILELPKEESDALIAELGAYITRPIGLYRHAWQLGDLVVWDNMALQHGRTDFDRKYKRHLQRVQIAGPEDNSGRE